jgi:hypothetical protein
MRPFRHIILGILVFFPVAASHAEIRTVIDRNDNEHASAAFKFERVPLPSPNNAASTAKFTIVDGRRDSNGGDLDQLNDGQLPTGADQPADNFFFSQRSNGGRLLMDLGHVIDIKEIDTYSWHTDSRAPQVYTLYASDGAAVEFNARPKRPTDPGKSGWKLVADVDSRPKEGAQGGQYGIKISDSDGSIGKFRYLLFDISQTESADAFGNTFYSEICVIDRHAPAVANAPASQPAANSKYQIIIDTSETPELADWAQTKLRPVLEKWYPIIVDDLPSEGFTAPKRFTVKFIKDMKGVADTTGTRVRCAAPWFKQELHGEAVGAVVHEMVHVVQQYHSRNNPGWLVEGIADYIRWFNYEPQSLRPHPNLARAKYTDSYRTTAAFLNYVIRTHDKGIVMKLNAVMRQGKYEPAVWKQFTGKTVDELWDEYVTATQ